MIFDVPLHTAIQSFSPVRCFSVLPPDVSHYPGLCRQVSATFAASLVTSPALGAYLAQVYDENMVIALSTAIAVLDVLFILVAVPESLPEKLRPNSWDKTITWEQADPFAVSGTGNNSWGRR